MKGIGTRHPHLPVDRVLLPSEERTRIREDAAELQNNSALPIPGLTVADRLVRLNPTVPLNNLEQISNEPINPKASHLLTVDLHPHHIYWVEVDVEK